MPVIRFIEGGPQQLKGAHAEISGHENPEYFEFVKAKLAEHVINHFSPEESGGDVMPDEGIGKTAEELLTDVKRMSRLVGMMSHINPSKIRPAALEAITEITQEVDETGIELVDVNNQRLNYDGLIDTEKTDFKDAIGDVHAHKDRPSYEQKVEVARLVAKDEYNATGFTIQPGKIIEHANYVRGNLAAHTSLGYVNEKGEYTPYVTVLAEPFKSDGTMHFGPKSEQDQVGDALLVDPIASELFVEDVEDVETDPETPHFPPARREPVVGQQ